MDTNLSNLPAILPALARGGLPLVNPVPTIEPRLRFSRRTTRSTPYPVASQVTDRDERNGRYLDIRV